MDDQAPPVLHVSAVMKLLLFPLLACLLQLLLTKLFYFFCFYLFIYDNYKQLFVYCQIIAPSLWSGEVNVLETCWAVPLALCV